jgi:hypothetical protein
MEYEYNKTYEFNIEAGFGTLPKETVNAVFQDGRVASHFLERQLEVWFPKLTFVNAKGYDHVDADSGRQLDQKSFTKSGMGFAPSAMLGAGRKINLDEAHDHANTIDYIACDVVDFPRVRVRFVRGDKLIQEYPAKACRVPFSARESFFS